MTTAYPWAPTEWDEIVPGLWQGGHIFKVNGWTFTTKLVDVRKFGYVVSLHDHLDKDTYPDKDIPHSLLEIEDDTIRGVSPEDAPAIHELVTSISDAMDQGKTVLVRCMAGYNRSGLVTALVLMRRGMSSAEAIALIREKRSRWALGNDAFVSYLQEWEKPDAVAG